MKVHARSFFPPGTSVHVPGARDNFGYSSPGGTRRKTINPDYNERFGLAEQEPAFDLFSNPSSAMSSPLASGMRRSQMNKSKSLQFLKKNQKSFSRLSQPMATIEKHEDEHFSYFVPESLKNESRETLSKMPLSKLSKASRISFPTSGEGTGFRNQGQATNWWPAGSYTEDQPTSYRTAFLSYPVHRRPPSPLFTAGSSVLSS